MDGKVIRFKSSDQHIPKLCPLKHNVRSIFSLSCDKDVVTLPLCVLQVLCPGAASDAEAATDVPCLPPSRLAGGGRRQEGDTCHQTGAHRKHMTGAHRKHMTGMHGKHMTGMHRKHRTGMHRKHMTGMHRKHMN